MSFDGFFLHHMTAELREQVLYGRIQKVNQPFERELVLTIRNNRQDYKLLLSAHPVFGRIQTTKAELPNPQNPNTYTMIMRKYLQGAVIEDIQQLENDRVLEISVSNKNEIGDSVKVTLVMEIMGKHSNIILIDKNENKIIHIIENRYMKIMSLLLKPIPIKIPISFWLSRIFAFTRFKVEIIVRIENIIEITIKK